MKIPVAVGTTTDMRGITTTTTKIPAAVGTTTDMKSTTTTITMRTTAVVAMTTDTRKIMCLKMAVLTHLLSNPNQPVVKIIAMTTFTVDDTQKQGWTTPYIKWKT